MPGNDSNTILLIQPDDIDGSTTFVDNSLAGNGGNGHTLNTYSVSHSTEQRKWGMSSIYYPQATARLSIAVHSDFDFDTDPFTIECFYRPESISTWQSIFGGWGSTDRRYGFFIEDTTQLSFYTQPGGYIYSDVFSAISLNEWHHFAVVGDGSDLVFYLDGTAKGGGSYTLPANPPNSFYEVGAYASNNALRGYVAEFRVSRAERYTSNFTPSTIPFGNYYETSGNLQSDAKIIYLYNNEQNMVSVDYSTGTHTMYNTTVSGNRHVIAIPNQTNLEAQIYRDVTPIYHAN